MLINDLKLIIDVIDKEKSKNLKKLRDRTLLLLGFAAVLEDLELVSIDVEDLEFVNEGVKILVKRSNRSIRGWYGKRYPLFQ